MNENQYVNIENVRRYYDEIVPDGTPFDEMGPVIMCPFNSAYFTFTVDGHQVKYQVINSVVNDDMFNEYPTEFAALREVAAYVNIYSWYMEKLLSDPIATSLIYLDIGGNRIDDGLLKSLIPTIVNLEFVQRYGIEDKESIAMNAVRFIAIVNLAISFMNCKNVKLVDEPITRQQRRFKERTGGIFYKVLDIEPFKEQVRKETQPGESKIKRALHICRGHFAVYKEENPLFGKHVGAYWKPMHVRGNKKLGEVIKDYNILLDE